MNFKTLFKYKKAFASFGQLAIGEFSSRVFAFLTSIYLARTLGADGFGLVGFVGTIASFFILFSNFGIEQYSAQQLSSIDIPAQSSLIKTVIGARLFLATFFVIVFIGFGFLYAHTESEFYFFLFQSLLIFAFAFNLQFYFVARKKIKALSFLRSGTSLAILLGSIAFVTKASDLPKVALVSGVITLTLFLLSVAWVFSNTRQNVTLPKYREIVTLVKHAAPLGISALMIQIYHSADIVFLGFTNPGVELGYYTGAYRIVNVLSIIPGIFYLIFLPDLAKISSDFFSAIATRTYVLTLICCGTLVTAGCYFFSGQLISLLLGTSYLPALHVFSILLINVFLIFVNVSLAHLLIAWNQHKKYLVVVSLGALTNIVCNIILIPRYGIIGAAIATVCAECAVLLTSVYYHHRLHGLFASKEPAG